MAGQGLAVMYPASQPLELPSVPDAGMALLSSPNDRVAVVCMYRCWNPINADLALTLLKIFETVE
jgi:hypothetical protein